MVAADADGAGCDPALASGWKVRSDADEKEWIRARGRYTSDVAGKFRFDGLPPGDYRILASFDLSEVDEEALEEARAMSVTMEASRTSTVDVPLWIAP